MKETFLVDLFGVNIAIFQVQTSISMIPLCHHCGISTFRITRELHPDNVNHEFSLTLRVSSNGDIALTKYEIIDDATLALEIPSQVSYRRAIRFIDFSIHSCSQSQVSHMNLLTCFYITVQHIAY